MKDLTAPDDNLRARLSAILDSTDDAIVAKDLNGIVQSWNRGAEEVFGYKAEEVVGKHISIIIPDDHLGEEDEIIAKIRAGERISHYETVRRRKDGRLIDVSLSITAIKNRSGRVIGASKIARDITEQKNARRLVAELNATLEERIRDRTADLEKALGDLDSFNSAVSHDLRTPLRAITGFIQIALEDRKVDGDLRRRLDMALQSAREMTRTIEALLRLARLKTERVRRESVDVTARCHNLVARLRAQHPGRDVQVEVEQDVRITADPAMVEVALDNLLSNAWKFTSRSNKAKIQVGRPQEAAGRNAFFVRDNGVGFAPTEAGELFRPFQRLRPAEFEGVGIGLATVQRIISAHRGTIRAEGTPGAGATFFVDFGEAG